MWSFRNRKHLRQTSRRAAQAKNGGISPAVRWYAERQRERSTAISRRRATSLKRSTALRRRNRRKETCSVSARKGFFTDTTLCIGCKACEVACKQWNQLPDDGFQLTGMSYDNTVHLGASTWRHVSFIERPVALATQDAGAFSWLFSSDVCKHCAREGWPQ